MDVINLFNKLQAQIAALDKKVDILIQRSSPKNPQAPAVVKAPVVNDHHKTRMMYTAVCADCRKECSIPFKPSGDRPVYCQDCFSRRKVINLSGVKFEQTAQAPGPNQTPSVKPLDMPNNATNQNVKAAKKVVTVKKSSVKKKPTLTIKKKSALKKNKMK